MAATALLYIDLRVRNENLNIEYNQQINNTIKLADYTIINDTTIDELKKKVLKLIDKRKTDLSGMEMLG